MMWEEWSFIVWEVCNEKEIKVQDKTETVQRPRTLT